MEPLEQWFVLSGYVRFHQWLGCQPYRLDNGSVSPFAVHTLVQFLAVAANLTLIIYRRRCILYHCEAIGMVVDFIKLLTVGLAISVTYVELFRNVNNVCSCWRMLYKAHRTLQRQGMVDRHSITRAIRLYWWFVVGTMVYFAGNEWYLYDCAQEKQTKRYYVYFFGLQYLLNIKLQQIIYPAIMLDLYLRMTRAALEHHVELLQCAEKLNSARYVEFLAGKINTLKLLHNDLYQASVEINEAYGRTYLVIYCKNYIHILSNSYWTVFWMLNKQPNHAARIVCRLISRTVLLAVTFYINTRAMNTATYLRHRLHSVGIGLQIKCRPLFAMVEAFQQQASMERIQLSAGYCFDLNFKPIFTQAVNQLDEIDCSAYDTKC
uniref:Gustatory receptor n=1 Tax=Anopheles epiroticus TaxID=199890 RepID=A0A182PLP3_9DIPT